MRTLAIVNQKGGSGKTTTAINLAAIFAARGMRTLLVDMDPQAHCAAGLGVPEERIEHSIIEALLHDSFHTEDLIWEVSRNLDLVPSTMQLARLEAPGGGLHELEDKDRRLLKVLRVLSDRYDRCVIDCPPTIGLMTYNAMRAAREALIPVETGYFAMKGAQRQWQTIRHLIERIDRSIAVHLLPTIHDPESRSSCEVLEALRRQFAGQIMPLVIHRHEELREAVSFGQPIVEYAPDSKARLDYERLAEWLEAHPPIPRTSQQITQQDPRVGWPAVTSSTGSESSATGAAGHSSPIKPLPMRSHSMASLPTATTASSSSSLDSSNTTLPHATGNSASPSSRAAEMVQRVQQMAQRSQQHRDEIDRLVERALEEEPQADDRPGGSSLIKSPERSSRSAASSIDDPADEDIAAPTIDDEQKRASDESHARSPHKLAEERAADLELKLDLPAQPFWIQPRYTAEHDDQPDFDAREAIESSSPQSLTGEDQSSTAQHQSTHAAHDVSADESIDTLPAQPTGFANRAVGAAPLHADTASSVNGAEIQHDERPCEQRPKPVVLVEEPPSSHVTPHSPPSAGLQHVFGVRQTSQGVLFVQPSDIGQSVAIAGQFNNWSPSSHLLRLNPQLMLWEAVIPIEPGTYAYRLVVDGKWQTDPYNARCEADQYGEQQSIITVAPALPRTGYPQQVHHPIVHVQPGAGSSNVKDRSMNHESPLFTQAIR